MEVGAPGLQQPMVRESWVDAGIWDFVWPEMKFSLGGRESGVSVTSGASGGRSPAVFAPHAQVTRILSSEQLDEGRMKEKNAPLPLPCSPD